MTPPGSTAKASSGTNPATPTCCSCRDLALGPSLFHWESQSTTTAASCTGQRFIHHVECGSRVFLFVGEENRRGGVTLPFLCLGFADYVRPRVNGDLSEAVAERLRVAVNRFVVEVELAQGGFGLPHRQLWQPGYAGLHGLEDGISGHLSAQIQGTGLGSNGLAGPAESADLRLHLFRTLAQALDGCLINAGHAGLHPLRGLHHLAHVHLAGLLHLGYIGQDWCRLISIWLLPWLGLSIGLFTWR